MKPCSDEGPHGRDRTSPRLARSKITTYSITAAAGCNHFESGHEEAWTHRREKERRQTMYAKMIGRSGSGRRLGSPNGKDGRLAAIADVPKRAVHFVATRCILVSELPGACRRSAGASS